MNTTDTVPGPLGWIPPSERTLEQQQLHQDIMNAAPRFALARPTVPKGTKIILTSFLGRPEVVADTGGEVFTGFRQLTGSCVGVSEGNAIAALSAVQRCIADTPTKAMIPWWGFPYGRSRYKSGMRTKGEGSITSIMGDVLLKEGCFAINEEGFNTVINFGKSDGWAVPSAVELQWSDGDETLVTQYMGLARQFPVGSVSPCNSIDDVAAGIINGYPCLNGCNYYMGNGRLNSEGIAIGSYSGYGGHATTYEGYWEHPSLGPLYLYHNQWGGSTYPQDNSEKPRCSVWTPESEARRLFQLGGDGGETMILSHLNYHPVQVDKILDYTQI